MTLANPAYLIGAILFGLSGYAAYRHGKRTSRNKVQWTGIALMRSAISGTAMLYLVGAALCLGSYVWRD